MREPKHSTAIAKMAIYCVTMIIKKPHLHWI